MRASPPSGGTVKPLLPFAAATAAFLAAAGPAGADFLNISNFTGVDAGDATKGPVSPGGNQAYGSTLSAGGVTLTSQLNGSTGSQLALAGDRVLNGGLGVGNPGGANNIGFTRSVNNSDTVAESIALDFGSDVGSLDALYFANAFSGAASVITISGFADDPNASSSDGSVSYDASSMTLTFTVTGQGNVVVDGDDLGNFVSTLSFADGAAATGGIVVGNGTTPSEANEFGLRGLSVTAVPEPASVAGLLSMGGLVLLRRRRGR